MRLTINTHEVYCYTGGKPFDPALPVVVLLHGAQNDHSVWTLQSRALAHRGHAVLAPDLPGHGLSAGPPLETAEAMAGWVLAVLDAAGVERALLAGHSMGSLIALEAAYLAPRRVSGLALLGTTYPMKVADTLLDTARDREGEAIDMVAAWSHASWLPGPSTAGPGTSVLNTARRLMQRMAARGAPRMLYTDFTACNAYANGESAAASVACPTLFVLGRKDIMTSPRSTARLTGAIGHARIVTVDAGHALMAEAPDAVLAALGDFAAAAAAGHGPVHTSGGFGPRAGAV